MKSFKFSIIFFFLFSVCNAQISIAGLVLSKETGNPIELANLSIKNTFLGTYTNFDGYFSFSFPENELDNYLVISALGYETKEINIKDISLTNQLTVRMKVNAQQLDEVIINADPVMSALEMVKKALSNYESNNTKYPYYARGFIRHVEKADNEYKWLVESAFELQDNSPRENVKINILETRKSLDARDLDTVKVVRQYLKHNNNHSFRKNNKKAYDYKNSISKSELKKAFNYYDNHYTNGFNKKLSLMEKIFSKKNILRNFNQKKSLFTKKNLRDFVFVKDSSYSINDRRTHKIKFTRLNKKSKTLDAGYIYITDSKISQINYSLILSSSHHYRRATGNKIRFSVEIRYKDYENTIYPVYFSIKTYKSSGYNYKNRVINTLVTHQEILLNEIINEDNSVKELSTNFINRDNNLFNERKYNPKFWENFNFLIENKKQKQLFFDLEKNEKTRKNK